MKFCGVGTEQIERALHAIFPNIRSLRADGDTTRHKGSHEELLHSFRSGKADVLIGTQMIAKGLHFPQVTLVGVLNIDASLHIPDFRASERVFQLITQVAGRSGRSELPGEVILQTMLPDHPILRLAAEQNYEAFYAREIDERRLFNYPPFCHLIKVSCSGEDPQKTEAAAESLHSQIQAVLPAGAELLPVIAAGYAKVKDQYRFQFLIKTPKISLFQPLLSSLAERSRCKVDIDPTSTFF